jgi:hypothetical protein
VTTAACTGCSLDQARRPFMGGRIRIGTASTPPEMHAAIGRRLESIDSLM